MDRDLLRRIAERDGSALSDLYDRHSQLLFGLIVRILRNRSEAEDILQDVFLRVWQRAETYDPAFGSPVAWLVRIARNRAIDRIRSRRSRPDVEPHPLTHEPAEPAFLAPDETAILGQQRSAINGALSALAPDHRILIESAFFEGYTQSELAEKFGLPLGTVKTRLRRAMQQIREQLEHFQK
jgi:RNA polymerase sigma-70 factor, ECF subfamily